MGDQYYCLSYIEFVLLLACMTINMLTLIIICFLKEVICSKKVIQHWSVLFKVGATPLGLEYET